MKTSLRIAAGITILVLATAAGAQTPTDITFHTRVEKNALNYLIEKTRIILNNAQIEDILTGEALIDTMPVFKLEEMTSDPATLQLRDAFAAVFKKDLKSAYLRLRVPKAFYQIQKLKVNPKSASVNEPALTLSVEATIEGLRTELTEGLYADLMIPNAAGQFESYLTAKLDPVSLEIPNTMEGMSFGVEFDTIRDQGFKFHLRSYDTSGFPAYVERNKSKLQILTASTRTPVSADQIKISPVVVRLNTLNRTVNFDTFKPIIQKRVPQLISSILTTVGNALKNKMGPKILAGVFSNDTRSELMINSEYIHSRYSTALFSQPLKDQLMLGIEGGLCTAKAFKEFADKCYTQGEPYEPVRTVSDEDRKKAVDEIAQQLAQGKSDLTISITEEYINRLIKTTIDAELWDERLEEDNLSLGPKGVFTVFDKRTQTPDMFIDLYYGGEGGVQSLFVNNRRPIRFPLRLSTSIAFEVKEGLPHLIVKTEKLLSDQWEIINGIPEYGLNSRLVRGFKKKIARMIIKMAAKLEGKVAVDLDFPVMKDVGLEKTSYETTPYGRLNWYFKL